ncbi:MAG: T9SS type A sorting domain-containing protein, partial [Ignavibacteriaceae bacterium]|nr:T9SS type A sorting domain-containing protein [Ignavibacteriaceae bacterium]
AVQFSSSAVSFGNVHVDYSSYQTNYIKNTGIADLSVTSVTSNSYAFTITSSGSFTLAPGDSAAITVKFLPSAVQGYNGTVSVASNVTGSSSVFTVSGSGVLNSESVELPAGWSLISLPVTPQSSAPADVFGDDTDFYLLYSYSSGAYSVPSVVQPKRGYWLGLSASDTIDVTGTAITAADSVALDSAWNLVANPFLSKFSLNNIQYSKNGVTLTAAGAVSAGWVQHNYIKYSSGSYSSVTDSLSKWEGYFLNALHSGVKVIFDRNYTGNDNFPVLNEGTSENWRVQITAALNNSADRYLCFGTSPAATTGFDPVYDYLKPPPVPSSDNIETWFTVPGSNEKFAHDVKEPFASNQSGYGWQFSLFSGSGGEVTISWNNILTEMPDYIKENFSFTLQGEAITVPDMLSTTSVTFSAEPNRIYNFYINPVPTGLEDTEPSLSDFRLDQNYPNPFNPETIISFSIPDAGYTTLTIYDAAGREIKNLVEGNISAGYHRVSFVATDLSSGVYFCRLTSGNYSAVRKLLLLR